MVERTNASREGGVNDMISGLISSALGGPGQRPTRPEKITIITAGYESGQTKTGVERGPEALLESGLIERLNMDHVEVMQCPRHPARPEYQTDMGVLKRPLAVSFNTQHLYQTVQRALKLNRPAGPDTLPPKHRIVTLGGDHSIAMGSIAAMATEYPELVVLWIDAHADINTPKSTRSGNLHGCPVAFLLQHPECRNVTGFDWLSKEADALHPKAGGAFLVPGRLGYIGLRDVEPQEAVIMAQLGLDKTAAYMSDVTRDAEGVRGCFQRIMQRLDPEGTRPLFVSFDIDGIDPRWAPSTGTPVERGLQLNEALELCRLCRDTGRLVGMDLVEVNPDLGSREDRKLTLETAIQVVTTLMS